MNTKSRKRLQEDISIEIQMLDETIDIMAEAFLLAALEKTPALYAAFKHEVETFFLTLATGEE